MQGPSPRQTQQAPADPGVEEDDVDLVSDGFHLRDVVDAAKKGDLRTRRGWIARVLRARANHHVLPRRDLEPRPLTSVLHVESRIFQWCRQAGWKSASLGEST